ncbi:metal ABC transporter permease [soil metagenome]
MTGATPPPILAQLEIVRWLGDPLSRALLLPSLAAGVAIVTMCAVLSVLVVVKRLAFVGQGVAHSALGGVGVAAFLAALTGAAWLLPSAPGGLAIIVAFCIAAALGMGIVADGKAVQVDTGIGLFLVGSMALGALLVEWARAAAERLHHPVPVRSWESVLFGALLPGSWGDALFAAAVAAGVLLMLLLLRRPLWFYLTDETAARAFGVPVGAMRAALMIALAAATVVAMQLTGVVLSSALLILPGASALKLSSRLRPVMALAVALGLAGLFGGVALALELDVQAGPCVVILLVAIFAAATVYAGARSSRHIPIPSADPAPRA